MSADQFLNDAAARLTSNGYTVTSNAQVGAHAALVGQISEFRWRWMATRVHLFVAVRAVDEVTIDELDRFTRDTLDYADAAKGKMRGFQSGVAGIGVLVGNSVHDGAARFAEREIVRRYAAFAWPVAVDATTQQVWEHTGRPGVGAVFTSWMRQQIQIIAPTR
jgi:hypothetical protein